MRLGHLKARGIPCGTCAGGLDAYRAEHVQVFLNVGWGGVKYLGAEWRAP